MGAVQSFYATQSMPFIKLWKTDFLHDALHENAGKKKNYGHEPALDTVHLTQKAEELAKTNIPLRGVLTLIGGFLLCLSFGSDFSFSNINTYLTSYMRVNGYNDNLSYVDFVFLPITKNLIQGVIMPWVGELARRMGPKIAIATGSAIYSGGYLLTYLTVQHHFSLAIFSLSLHGLAFCFVYATTIKAAQAWFPPDRKGLVTSIVVSGYGFGSSLWAPIQTGFVNPGNLKAGSDVTICGREDVGNTNCTETDTDTGNQKYFTDPAVLDRVPFMFIVLGIIYAVMGIIAVVLIAEPEEGKLEENKDRVEDIEIQKIADRTNLTPWQVLKTRWFYQIWTGFLSISLTIGIMGTYSKTFGLTFINDDHFYSIVAVFQHIFNGFSRIFWGISFDRFGFKKCFAVICAVVCLTVTTLPLLPSLSDGVGGRVCYGLWMCLLYATCPGIYVIIAAEVIQAFGPLHYQANFGLLFTQNVAYCAVIIVITKGLFSFLGYSGMFLTAGAFGVLGLMAVLGRWCGGDKMNDDYLQKQNIQKLY